jgi:hypothetical protein
MAEEYIKAEDIPGFEQFPAQLKRLLSYPSERYSSKGFLKKEPVYFSSYTTREYKNEYMFYSEKCVVTLNATLAPKSIDIDMFKCFGHKKGAGRKLLCYALTWIKEELGLPSQTVIGLEADPTYRNNVQNEYNKALDAENENGSERIRAAAMKSLKAYYARYGFKGKGSGMEARLTTILGKCQSGGTRKKRRSARTFNSNL